jgi:hypothetical protein
MLLNDDREVLEISLYENIEHENERALSGGLEREPI